MSGSISSVGSAQVAHGASMKVMKEANDVSRQQGDAAISLLEQAAEVAKAAVRPDGHVDVVA